MLGIDLFSGAGGLSRGLESAGFKIALAVEVNRYAATSYRANFPDVDVIQDDLREIAPNELLRKFEREGRPLGALVAGLPCQGFSESNRMTRSRSNPKNQLYREFGRLLHVLKPRWFIVENVSGIMTLESGRFLKSVLRSFRASGYSVECELLNAADYGVPQVRRRAFLVGNRLGAKFEFPSPVATSVSPPTVADAILDLAVLRNGASVDTKGYRIDWSDASEYARTLRVNEVSIVSGNSVSRNSAKVIERYKLIPRGKNWESLPREMMSNYSNLAACHTGIYHRLDWSSPSKVIGNFRKNMLIHPSQQRGLSVREAARIQSFPDQHIFLGPLNDRQQQVGDAVPPLLARAVGRAVILADLQAS